jgi:hypothetical protein
VSKKYLFLIVLFVLGSVSAFSVEVNLAKESYFSGETLQAEIFIDGLLEEEISTGDIKLFCDGSFVGISPSLLKLETNHYYSFFGINKALSSQECSFVMENIIYYDEGFVKQDNFYQNFSLVIINDSIVFVNPAGIKIDEIGSQNNFRIYLENVGDEQVNISISTDDSFVELSSGGLLGNPETSGYFDVYLSEFLYAGQEKSEINIDYNGKGIIIPIWIFSETEENITQVEENITYVDESLIEFVMEVSMFNVSLSNREDLSGYVTIKNMGQDLTKVDFSLTGNLSAVIDLQSETLGSLGSGESFKEYLYVNQMKDAPKGFYEGSLKVNYETKFIEFPILVEIKEGEIVSNGTGDGGDVVDPGDPPKDDKEISIWWFVLIILVIALGVVFFLYKKRTKKGSDFLQRHV